MKSIHPSTVFLIIALICATLLVHPVIRAAAPDEAPDPCALVSKAEVEKIIGELKEAPKADTGLQKEKVCDYTTMTGAWLKVSLYSSERWGMQKGIVSEMNPTPLAALGEEAFTVKRGTTNEVYVRKGKLILEVSSTVGAELTKKFAESAVKQLP